MTAPIAARTVLADLLRAGLPAWNVIDKARTPDSITKPTAIVWTSRVQRLDLNGFTYLTSTVDCWVIVPTDTSPDKLEDRLDQQLLDVLQLIEGQPAITWNTAERGVLDEALHGWHLTTTITHQVTPSTTD